MNPLRLAVPLAIILLACSEPTALQSVSSRANDMAFVPRTASDIGLGFFLQPPYYVPFANIPYTWGVQVEPTACNVSDPCEFIWYLYKNSNDIRQICDHYSTGGDMCTATVSQSDGAFNVYVEVWVGIFDTDPDIAWSHFHHADNACTVGNITGTWQVYATGNYTFSNSISGTNCTDLTRSWGGDASGSGTSATVHYDICPNNHYAEEVTLTASSQGYSVSKDRPTYIDYDWGAC